MSLKEVRRKYAEFVNSDAALVESRRWIEVVTGKHFNTEDFRESLANGLLLCELLENIGIPVGRVNRATAAYAGIDNINLFLKGCENLGLKKLHLFDINDLQDVLGQRRSSIASRAKESQKRLQNVAITIFWLEKVARRQGFRGPVLHQSCFKHLLPEPYSQLRRRSAEVTSKKLHESRNRYSVEPNFAGSKSHKQQLSSNRKDKILSQLSIQDKREKFKQIEQEAIREASLRRDKYSRRKSTGSSLLGKERNFEEERRKRAFTDMSDNRNFYKDQTKTERESAALQKKMRTPSRGSSSTDSGATSPPPIPPGNRANVDLKGKQKFFEEQERATERDSAVRSDRTRPKSWGPGEIDKLAKRRNQRDVSFKDKHLKYEQLQRQAEMESATLQGKIRPQLSADSRDGPSKPKAVLPTRADVQLGDKRRKFEKLDHQAQMDSAVLRGDRRVSLTDGKEVRRQYSGSADPKLRRQQEMFENLERQASEDKETLQGKRRLSTSDREHSKRSSGVFPVFLPKDADVKLGDKKSKFEELDQQAQKESNILRMNQSRSTGSLAREPRSFDISNRRHEETSTRHPAHAKTQRPNNNEYQPSGNVAPHIKDIHRWETTEEPMEFVPDTKESHLNDASQNPSRADDTPQPSEEAPQRLGRAARFTRERYGNNSFDFEDTTEHQSFSEEQIQPESAPVAESAPEQEAQDLSYRDLVQPPPREKRKGFSSRKQPPFDDTDHKPRREERNGNQVAEKDESLHSGGFSYNDYVPVPKGGQRKKKFLQELEREKDPTEMPWRQEVRQLKDRPPREEMVPPRHAAKSRPENDDMILSQRTVDSVPKLGSLKRDAYLKELEREKGVREMPWRQEVKELKERSPREEEPEGREVPESRFESPDDMGIRKMKYRDFAIAPHKSVKKDTFVREEHNEKQEGEMPWRQELRDLRDRPPTEEQVEPSTERFTESAYDEDEVNFSYRDFVPVKQGSLKPNKFLQDAEWQNVVDEMPWRQEVRELKKSSSAKEDLSEDEPIPNYTETTANPSPRKMSYRDISRPPSSKSRDTFVGESQKVDNEMPWRTEVRELQNRGPREEVQDEDTDNRRSRGRPREYSKPSPPPRSKSSSILDGRKLSYHDFVCPPSMMNRDSPHEKVEQLRQPKSDAPKKRYKVQDLTRRFTEIEADQLRPKEGGIPSRKSLVNKDELERIEREMKSRTWHGFPAEYSDHANRRAHEDGFPYRSADISADNYNEVFEDPEILFEKHENRSVPTEFQQEPVVQNDHAKTEETSEVFTDYKFDPHAERERTPWHDRMDTKVRYLQDELNKPEQVPVNRVTAHSREYPTQKPQCDGEKIHQREHNAPRHQEQYRMVDRGDHGERQPSKDSEASAHRYQHQPDRDVFQPQTTSVLYSVPDPPMEQNQRPPTKDPRNSAKSRTIYLWSNENEASQEPLLQRFNQQDNTLNAPPMGTDGKSYETAEPHKRGFEDRARNDRTPLQNSGNEYGSVPKEMASRASDLEERPLRIRSNVFAIVGKSSQVPQLHSNRPGSTEDVHVPDGARQVHPSRKQDVNEVPREDARQGQLAQARVLDINEERLDLTRNGDGGYLYGRQEAGKGTREKLIKSEIPKDEENRELSPETEQIYFKKQLRDADYRAKLRNELSETNRKHRESAQYLLSQMQASYSSDGEEEFDGNGKLNDHKNGLVCEVGEKYNKPPQKGSIRDDNLMDMVEKQEREREKERVQTDRQADVNHRQQRIDRFNGHSNRSHTEEDGTTAQETERFMRERNQPQKQKPEYEAVEPLIEAMEKPSQTFSLNELSDIFKDDEPERWTRPKREPDINSKFQNDRSMDQNNPTLGNRRPKREPDFNSKFQNDRSMDQNNPTLGNRGYHNSKLANGNGRYDMKNNFDRNGYAGYDYPEPDVHSQRKGLQEDKHYKAEVRPENNRPSRKDQFRPDGHSTQYAPVEFKPAKKGATSLKNGPLEDGYRKAQMRSKINGMAEDNDRLVDERSTKNGPMGYSIYETFVHGESNHVVCEYCGTTIEKSPSMFVAEVNKYWHLHCFQCVVCQETFDEHSSYILHITDLRLHCERCFITEEGERCTEV